MAHFRTQPQTQQTSDDEADDTCRECGSNDFIEDMSQGDMTCRQCGVVKEAHLIDRRTEWRTFADSDKSGPDPSRVGGPEDPLLAGRNFSLVIGKSKGEETEYTKRLSKSKAQLRNPDRLLHLAFDEISNACDKLDLSGAIKSGAKGLYRSCHDAKIASGKSMRPLVAACIRLACSMQNQNRTLKEIAAAWDNMAVKDIHKHQNKVMEVVRDVQKAQMVVTNPADVVKRWTNTLQFTKRGQQAALKIAERAKPREDGNHVAMKDWHRRRPDSIAAAIVYLLSFVPWATSPGVQITVADLIKVSGVAEATMKSVYDDMYPFLREVAPEDVISEEDFQGLPVVKPPPP